MLLPLRWINDYINIEDIDPVEFANRMTDSGTHIEEIEYRNIKGLVTGKVLTVDEHPDADKLSVTTVDIGGEELTIVCGAPNVEVDQIVPVATVGTVLPGDFEIKKAKVRGVESNGMICSLDELGYSQSVVPAEYREGIYVYSDDIPVGVDGSKALDLDFPILECEITPNRPDCLSMIGLAREVSATFDRDLDLPEEKFGGNDEDISDYFGGIEIETDNCNRFYARVLKDVVIEESPQWLQNRLMEAGIRPINNMVDLTNFVMLEYGQPTHAYDLTDLRDKRIKVYQAGDDEKFTTLDGVERTLSSEDMVIADGQGPIGIAGVMGGLDSEIKDDTTTILLEGASFDKSAVRHTSKRLGLRTEASSRFEKGVDPKLAKTAVDRIATLAEEIGAATLVGGSIDKIVEKREEYPVTVRIDKANQRLGIELSSDKMVKYLDRLGLSPVLEDDIITCTIPTFRPDISIEEDLIEEIGRLYGYNNIEPKPIVGAMTRGKLPKDRIVARKLKDSLRGLGFNELLTYSFISPSLFDKLDLPEDDIRREAVELINPLGEEFSVMRTTMMGNTLDVFAKNQNHNVDSMLAMEIGNIFSKDLTKDNLPTEWERLSIGGYGKDIDFYYLKESIEKSLHTLGIDSIDIRREENNGLFHPGRCGILSINGEDLGIIGEVHPTIMKNFDLKQRVVLGELDFDLIVENYTDEIEYQPLPKYPASDRDLAIIVDKSVLAKDIEQTAIDCSGDLLESFNVFDIYEGSQIPEDKKSIAFRMIFRDHKGTLKDETVNDIIKKIIARLEDDLDAVLRDQ